MQFADYDNDQDLDLVIGNISGEVYFVRNESTAGEHAFAEPEQLSADGVRLGHYMEKLAGQADKVALVRSMTSTQGAHGPGR